MEGRLLSLIILISLAGGTDFLALLLYQIGRKLGNDFLALGLNLGMDMSELEQIKTSNPHISQDWGNILLVTWKRRQEGADEDIKKRLAYALRNILRNDLAKLCEQEQTNEQTTVASEGQAVKPAHLIIYTVIITILNAVTVTWVITLQKGTEQSLKEQLYYDDQLQKQTLGITGERVGTPNHGTIGGCAMFRFPNGQNISYALTAHHVVKHVKRGGDVGIYTGTSHSVTWGSIGTLEYSIDPDLPDDNIEQLTTYDLTLIKLSRKVEGCVNCELKPINNDIIKQKIVRMKGKTGENIGKVMQYSYSGKVRYEIDGKSEEITLLNAIQIQGLNGQPFGGMGDGGSLVYIKDDYNPECYIIGMFYFLGITKDNTQVAYAFPLHAAFEELTRKYPELEGIRGYISCSGKICNTIVTHEPMLF